MKGAKSDVTLLYYHEQPLGAPLANLVAVPWVGFVVVPAVLGGTLLLPLWEAGGGLVLELAHTCIAWLWPYLEVLESQAPVLRATGTAPEWAVAAGGVGAIVLLAPRGWPGRWVGVAWFLPLALTVPDGPARGELWVSVLDVGQGLSVVLRTERRVLVYDAGPWFSESFDAGAGIVVPYLQAQGLNRLDMLVLSHGHRDHVGGARSLLERIPTNVVLGNVPNLGVEPGRNLACRAGHRWIWDEVQFQVVHPARGDKAQGNDASCALLVRTGGASILLPGDLERHGEATLTERYPGPNDLKADFLVVPHHGSATSSSQALLDAVDPRLALLSVGYRNRFGLPASAVMARYRARNVPVIDTATSGAIELRITPGRDSLVVHRHRVSTRRYWHWRAPAPPMATAYLEGAGT